MTMPKTDSPFRYPGGKTQLYPFVKNILDLNDTHNTYIEPFAGGAGIPIKLILNNEIESVWINDYDKSIFSVWYAILHRPSELIKKIKHVPFDYTKGHLISPNHSIAFWRNQQAIYLKEKGHQYSLDLAFATLLLNRTNTSGIITGGPLGGYEQNHTTQIYARFNKQTLIDKINLIYSFKHRITLTRLNALDMIPKIRERIDPTDSFIFFDPPYFEQGKNLYYSSFNESGHLDLAKEILALTTYHWITTYDTAPQIQEDYRMATKRFEYYLNYSANNKRRGQSSEFMFASPITKIDSFDKVNLSPLTK